MRRFNMPIPSISQNCAVIMVLTTILTASCNSNKKAENVKDLYSIYDSFNELLNAKDAKYFETVRVSPVGTEENPMYHGFFFYNCSPYELHQFDPSGRYMLGMRVFIEGREVQPEDRGEIGYFDLHSNYKWIKIGETTAWNWQQGCRLQWIPGSSDEIIWNDCSDDGNSLVSRIFNIRTKKIRTLPITVYTISPDGNTLLTVNFERIIHGGCNYVCVENPLKNQWAPDDIGIWKMDMRTEKTEMLMSVRDMARILYPDKFPSDTLNGTLYFFREGFNYTGDRFIAFVKDAREVEPGRTKARTEGFSMDLDGKNVKYLYKEPSHHFWLNDNEIMDNGFHTDPFTGETVRGYFRFVDDATGVAKEKYFDAPNGHITLHNNKEWILTDTYTIDGYIYLYMYHLPTKKFVPLARLAYKLGGTLYTGNPGIFRVDLHPRFSPDGMSVSIDSTHEGFGRQLYLIDISKIIDNPPQ